MITNFLGSSGVTHRATSLISTAELSAREGVVLQKGMNFRDKGPLLSVFLVLPTHDGEYWDFWDELNGIYMYEGHDSTTVDAGKEKDQVLMYSSGKLSENGKFFKAAQAFRDGIRSEALQVQVYEKIDGGVWFAKGIFNITDAQQAKKDARTVFRYHLVPADWGAGFAADSWSEERMLPVSVKVEAWRTSNGACVECGDEKGLRFVKQGDTEYILKCALHRGESARSGLLG